MTTFYYSTQTCSTAVHIALEEAGVPFQGVEVSWKRKVNVEELAKVNSLGQVPVLVDGGGRSLNQTIAILPRIAEMAPDKKLLPAPGTTEYSAALSLLAFIGADFQKAFLPLFFASRWTQNADAQNEIRKGALDTVHKNLAFVDQVLAEKEFVLGSQFSLVDAYLFTILGWCKWSEVKVSGYSNILPYMKRVLVRPAVQKVLAKEEMLDFLPA